MESYLGDVCGEPLPPMLPIPRRRYDGPRWIETITGYVIGWIAVSVFTLLVIAFVAMMFLYAKQSIAAELIVTPKSCVRLAEMFGATLPERVTHDEAKAALSNLNFRMILVSEARACRKAIERELAK